MANWEIPSDQIIDYSPNGDDIDSFSQKVKWCLEAIFDTLKFLHSNGAVATLDDIDNPAPYEIRIKTTDNGIYMYDGTNQIWVLLGYMSPWLGITPERISAIKSSGGLKRISIGLDGEKTDTGNSTNDLYFATDTTRVWKWTGTKWELLLSRQFADTIEFEAKCVNRDELTEQGGVSYRGKVLQLDSTSGKANVDITGSAERLGEGRYKIDLQNPQEGQAFVFDPTKDGGKGAFVNRPMMFPTNIVDPQDGQILVYNAASHEFHNANNAGVGAGRTLTLRNGTTTLAAYNGSEMTDVDLSQIIPQTSSDSTAPAHLIRMVENLYFALDVSKLNPGGYDGFFCETFRDDAKLIDKTNVSVTALSSGSATLTVATTDRLSEGLTYRLTDGSKLELVKIEAIDIENNTVELEDEITKSFNAAKTKLVRTNKAITEEGVSNNAVFATVPVIIGRSQLDYSYPDDYITKAKTIRVSVHHDNVQDVSINVEVATHRRTFAKGVFIGVSIGTQLHHLAQPRGFYYGSSLPELTVYFDGVEQPTPRRVVSWSGDSADIGWFFDKSTGYLYVYGAPSGTVITADYYLDGFDEEFESMTKVGTYVDQTDASKAVTEYQFRVPTFEEKYGSASAWYPAGLDSGYGASAPAYKFKQGTSIDVACSVYYLTLRFTTKRLTGTATESFVVYDTNNVGFKLSHQATGSSAITVTPAGTTWSYDENNNAVVVTNGTSQSTITVNYGWKGKSFSVDSFACMFDE